MWAGIGAIVGALIAAMSSHNQNNQNKDFSREQMANQQANQNTAYQRQQLDMKAAGLNPILGISSGGSGSAQATSANMNAPLAGFQNLGDTFANSAAQRAKNKHEIDNLVEQGDNIASQTSLNKALEEVQKEEVDVKSNSAKNLEQQNAILKLEQQARKAALPGQKAEGEIDQTKYGEIMRYIKRAIPFMDQGVKATR